MTLQNKSIQSIVKVAAFLLYFHSPAYSQTRVITSVNDIKISVEGEYVGGLVNGNPAFNAKANPASTIVKTKSELLDALATAKSGSIVYVDDGAEIDLSGHKNITIRAGITLASGRGHKGSMGALLKTSTPGTSPLFVCGSNVKIFGLRFDGGDPLVYHKNEIHKGENANRKNTYNVPVSIGIKTNYPNLEITNCEFYGWTHAAISLQKGSNNAKIMYNYIHHNRRFGLGYGINLDGSSAFIMGNIFDYNRHDIAGTGVEGTSYEACYNVFLQNGTSHSVDMHGGKDRNDNTDIAGTEINVHNNRFVLFPDRKAVVVRGKPIKRAIIKSNTVQYVPKTSKAGALLSRILGLSTAVAEHVTPFDQLYSKGNMTVTDNEITK